jgi:hypothetical protein
MKKQISLCLFLAFSPIAQAWAQEASQTIQSKIEHVTVFFSGAQVKRLAQNIPLSIGKTELVFKDLPQNLDKQSLQVQGEGDFTILSVMPRTHFSESVGKRDTIVDLEKQKEVLEDRIKLDKNQLEVLNQEEAFIKRNQVQILGIGNSPLKFEDLKQAIEFQRLRLADIFNKKFEIEKDLSTLNLSLLSITSQLQDRSVQKSRITSEVVVLVNSKTATPIKRLELSYIIPNAAWKPSYDLRVKDIGAPLSMQVKATVLQNSGEDWKEVKLSLSTSNPTESGLKPELSPWRLQYYRSQPLAYALTPQDGYLANFKRNPSITQVSGRITDSQGEPLIGAVVVAKGTNVGATTDINGRYTLTLPPNSHVLSVSFVGFNGKEVGIQASNMDISLDDGAALQEVVVTALGRKEKPRKTLKDAAPTEPEVEETVKATTVSYDIDLPYTVLTGSRPQTVDIKDLSVPALYQYYVVPKLDKDAFLVAQIVDWEQYQLLSGEANLFFEGTYTGKTLLNTLTTDDTLRLSLGRDKNVVVTRTKLKDFSKTKFLSDKRQTSRAFDIAIRNKRAQNLNIIVEDQIPISSNNAIEVTAETGDAEVDLNTGKLVWRLEVSANKERKVKFNYTVRYPKGETILFE